MPCDWSIWEHQPKTKKQNKAGCFWLAGFLIDQSQCAGFLCLRGGLCARKGYILSHPWSMLVHVLSHDPIHNIWLCVLNIILKRGHSICLMESQRTPLLKKPLQIFSSALMNVKSVFTFSSRRLFCTKGVGWKTCMTKHLTFYWHNHEKVLYTKYCDDFHFFNKKF